MMRGNGCAVVAVSQALPHPNALTRTQRSLNDGALRLRRQDHQHGVQGGGGQQRLQAVVAVAGPAAGREPAAAGKARVCRAAVHKQRRPAGEHAISGSAARLFTHPWMSLAAAAAEASERLHTATTTACSVRLARAGATWSVSQPPAPSTATCSFWCWPMADDMVCEQQGSNPCFFACSPENGRVK